MASGLLGLAAFLWLTALLAARALRAQRGRAWAFGAAADPAAYALVEPIGLVLTPLLFLFTGVAAGTDEPASARTAPVRGPFAWGVAAALTLATIVSMQMLAAERLALRWALDGRAGDPSAAQRARDVIERAVGRHQWDADVWFWAADVETLLRDEAAARAWVAEQLRRFPGECVTVEEADPTGPENPFPGA